MPTSNFTPDHIQYPYPVYSIQVRYTWVSGNLMLPVAAPYTPGNVRPTAEVVQTHAPYGLQIASFVAVRRLVPPVLPDPASYGDGAILLSSDVVTESPALDANGVDHIYAVRGVYVFGMPNPATYPTDGLSMAKVPYDQTPVQINALQPNAFDKNLLAPPPANRV